MYLKRIHNVNVEPIKDAESFSEFEKAYGYLAEMERHRQDIQNAIEQHFGKTLIITEGATDWKHMKAAYESLKEKYE